MKDVTGAFRHLTGEHPRRACRACGCTELDACAHPDGRACHWVAPDLCSACANTIAEVMLAIDVTDRQAEDFLRVLVAHEAARRGMTPPAFRREAHAAAVRKRQH